MRTLSLSTDLTQFEFQEILGWWLWNQIDQTFKKKKNSSAFLYKKDFSDFGGIKFSSFGNALQKHLFRTKFVHSEMQMV